MSVIESFVQASTQVSSDDCPALNPPAASPTSDTVCLAVDGLSVRYGSGPAAVNDVSFRIARGERVALVGESGSGKTTLGLAVAGFLTQPGVSVTARRLEFDGRPIATGSKARLPGRVPGIAMVFQDAMTSLDPVWSIGSQLRAVLRGTEKISRAQARDQARYWLERVGLLDTARVMKSRSYELSGGMRQRAMLALALCGRPRLLIADEPTSALDASLSRKTMDLLLELTDGLDTSVLIVSHDIKLCQEYSDTTMVMYRGEIVETRPSADLDAAQHPYTAGLLRCIPTLERAFDDELPTLETTGAVRALFAPTGSR
jgi:ABC-type dipeptide/oligopeptide/nickel transport system ATPase component